MSASDTRDMLQRLNAVYQQGVADSLESMAETFEMIVAAGQTFTIEQVIHILHSAARSNGRTPTATINLPEVTS